MKPHTDPHSTSSNASISAVFSLRDKLGAWPATSTATGLGSIEAVALIKLGLDRRIYGRRGTMYSIEHPIERRQGVLESGVVATTS